MTGAVEKLTALATAADRFDIPSAELRDVQVDALQERFEERRGRIPLLARRAEDASAAAVRSVDDAVPLLFPHTAYKSYPESFLFEGKWDRLGKWLGTISPYPIPAVDAGSVNDIDDWIAKLEQGGCFVSCSSGTTGKSAMLAASARDMAWSRVDTVAVFSWGSGVTPARDRRVMGLAPVAEAPKNRVIGEAQAEAYGDPEKPRFRFPAPPITVGALTRMVLLRKAVADGSARPSDIAAYETTSKDRQQAMDRAVVASVEAMITHRGEKLFISGMWNSLYQIAKGVREAGYSAKDFHPDNCIYVGGGLKRAQLPPDYQAFVHETFNIAPDRTFQNYSMQELNSGMPRCRKGGRYHIPPWVVPFLLDKEGAARLPDVAGEQEGRAAFFDLSLDGRWGGVITGDKISIDFGPCACGARGPSVRDNIVRYADIEGDDKIGCAGTVEAYVRGLS